MRTLACLCVSVVGLLGGACSTPVSGYNGPDKWLMTSPAPFPDVAPGDDGKVVLKEAAAAHNKNARKIKGLQKYVRLTQKGT